MLLPPGDRCCYVKMDYVTIVLQSTNYYYKISHIIEPSHEWINQTIVHT